MENKIHSYLETNKEIANFLCYAKYKISNGNEGEEQFYRIKEVPFNDMDADWHQADHLRFHRSWDWIMIALGKAQETLTKMGLDNNVMIDKTGTAVYVLGLLINIEYAGLDNTNIETVYKAVLTLVRYIQNINTSC